MIQYLPTPYAVDDEMQALANHEYNMMMELMLESILINIF